jgi:hypothetical protein
MSHRLLSQAEREELWRWIQRPLPPYDPAPDWIVKVVLQIVTELCACTSVLRTSDAWRPDSERHATWVHL